MRKTVREKHASLVVSSRVLIVVRFFVSSEIHSGALRGRIDQPRVPVEPETLAVAASSQGSRGVGQIRHHPQQHRVQGPDGGRSGPAGLLEGHRGRVQGSGGVEELAAAGPGRDRRGPGADGERRSRRTHHLGHSQNTRVQVSFRRRYSRP